VNFGPFMQKLESVIRQTWNPQASDRGKVVLRFRVTPSGQLERGSLRVVTANDRRAREEALRAVQVASASFPTLPNGANEPANIEFTFYSDHIR
jgi:TonB family protein